MKRALIALTIAALVLPATAFAKGPSEATISGGGGGGGGGGGAFTIKGCCTPDSSAMKLAEQAGFFPAVFGQEPSPMLASRPKGDLGPKYTIAYTVPGPNNEVWTIRQDLYPYAQSGPVTYTPPGQDVFETRGTRGGWFQADPVLKETLVNAGLPSSAAGASAGSSEFPTALLSLLTGFLLVAMATALFIRRRARPATA